MTRLTKSFPVFDCDAHVNDPLAIWDYVAESERELVRATYWRDDRHAFLNGTMRTGGGGSGEYAPLYNPITIGGPQMGKKIVRRLMERVPLDDAQREHLDHKGAYDPKARLRDLDLMGIDQVLVIPSKILANLPFAENPKGVAAFCRAYNDFARDWCDAAPERLYPAGVLPLQSPEATVVELQRIAARRFPVALMRPIDARGQYPNDLGTPAPPFGHGGILPATFDDVFRAFEETGVVLGMHTFPAHKPQRTAGPGLLASPGEMLSQAGVDSQTLSFIFEAQTWLTQVLLGGFLDRYPKLRVAVFESNATWLPAFLDTCDRLFHLYANERKTPARRLPSEAFYEQCVISFESDETAVFRQPKVFEEIGIWSSDAYHQDGADAWSAIGRMREAGVSEEIQARLMGGNARRMYGIEPKLCVTEEPGPLERPEWFPGGAELEEWAERIARPRGARR